MPNMSRDAYDATGAPKPSAPSTVKSFLNWSTMSNSRDDYFESRVDLSSSLFKDFNDH